MFIQTGKAGETIIRTESKRTIVVFGLLEGKNVNLRVMEKEDTPLVLEWLNNPEFYGQYFSPMQRTTSDWEKASESNPFEFKDFIIEKKDGTKIGFIAHCFVLHPWGKIVEIGYGLVQNERGRGYSTEAAQLMVDYLFLSKEIECIQASTDIENTASQRVLEKTGFKKEGIMRKRFFYNGQWKDMILFSILREEWKEPKILTKNPKL